MTTRLVLVGAGHAHLHLLQHADTLRRAGYRITLVAPSRFWYSGMAARLLSGAPRTECSLDIASLSVRHAVEHITAPFAAPFTAALPPARASILGLPDDNLHSQ